MWREIRFAIGQEQAEQLADALLENGALSVTLEDANAGSSDEQPLFGEPGLEPLRTAWQYSHLTVLLTEDQVAQQLLQQVCNQLNLSLPEYSYVEVAEQDWVRLTQAQFNPIHISPKLWIVPSWHTLPSNGDILALQLDPGLAFGTGSHPTTRLCLRWLETHVKKHQSVLDYGCGSGILALAACKLGADPVWGTDIDPQAIQAAQSNNQINHCAAYFALPNQIPVTPFDIVIANILSNPLKMLAPMLCRTTAKNGRLVLSGVLSRQCTEVITAYAPYLALTCWAEEDGWACLVSQPSIHSPILDNIPK